ncbi:MAG: hypothetical protein ACK44O_16725, partial [Novosphingobium sp.]
MLAVARRSEAANAVRIAASIDETFPPGTDVSAQTFAIRDDYTSLMWLGGTKALYELGDASRAAPLFYRYGAAARSPQTRTKGYYWAGRAMAQAGNLAEANRYFEMAAIYPEQTRMRSLMFGGGLLKTFDHRRWWSHFTYSNVFIS